MPAASKRIEGILGTAARTTEQEETPNIISTHQIGIARLRVSAGGGAGGLAFRWTARDNTSLTNYVTFNAKPTLITATGDYMFIVTPMMGEPQGLAVGTVMQVVTGMPLPRYWGIKVEVEDTTSFTYRLDVDLIEV